MNSDMSTRRPLRLWPGVVIVAAQWLTVYGLPVIAPDLEVSGLPVGVLSVAGGALGGVAVALWWLFFSRARWSARIGAVGLAVAAVWALKFVVHESIAGAGQGVLIFIAPVPGLCLAWVVWAAVSSRISGGARQLAFVAAVLSACAPWVLIRTAGVGGAGSEYHWRWTPTPEERLLAMGAAAALPPGAPAASPPAAPVAVTAPIAAPIAAGTPAPPAAPSTTGDAVPAGAPAAAEWPGFRGAGRDSVVRGTSLTIDWATRPPVELWRRPVGPGWSSFAVRGDRIYTQEQRGEEEIVACYRLTTGEPVWHHSDAVRFWESNGGAGPRATPTIDGDRVYTFGATGILNALDAASGRRLWTRNVSSDTGRDVPTWGFTSSPLVVDDVVIVAASGTLAGYDRLTGAPRWKGPSYGGSYSSPHRATIDGVVQVVLLGGPGAIGLAPADGAVLWTHEWSPGPIVQPAVMADGDLLVNAIAATGGLGLRRLALARKGAGAGPGEWTITERWTSTGLKPNFNDFVVHEGHAYGFDGTILSAIDLADGHRVWKGGRYGNGQMLLLPDQDLILVLAEEGDLALVSATPDKYTEISRVPALEGKTWNHPVLVGDVLLVRNGQEMAAFRLQR